MSTHVAFTKVLTTVALIGLLSALYLLLVRPYQLRWGATDAEVRRPMPGDGLSLHPTFLATRAITIEGTPADIWPWLVQMGYGRAGFYGYDILENLGSPRGIRSAEAIAPELQRIAVGDPLPLSAVARVVVHAMAPNNYLVWAGQSGAYPGAFTWALYPVDARHTRLVSRIQWSHHWAPPSALALDLFTEFTDFVAVRKILQGVKGRVEGRVEPMARQNIEFAIYVWSLVSPLVAIGMIFWRPLTWPRWLAALGAGLAWLIVWYAPITMGTGALANLVVLWGMYQGSMTSRTRTTSPHIAERGSP
jgi:hypothetical protein